MHSTLRRFAVSSVLLLCLSAGVFGFSAPPAPKIHEGVVLEGQPAVVDPKLPDWALATNGKDATYIDDVLRDGLITNKIERAFLEKIAHNEAEFPLAKALGYVAKRDWQKIGTTQDPGKEIEPLYSDNSYFSIQSGRMRLGFHAIDKERSRHVLVFTRQSGWSTACDICAVITDSEFAALAWRESQGRVDFGTGTLRGKGKKSEDKVFMPLAFIASLESVSPHPVMGVRGSERTVVISVKKVLLGHWKEKSLTFRVLESEQVPLSPKKDYYIIASQDRSRVLIGAAIPLNEEDTQTKSQPAGE